MIKKYSEELKRVLHYTNEALQRLFFFFGNEDYKEDTANLNVSAWELLAGVCKIFEVTEEDFKITPFPVPHPDIRKAEKDWREARYEVLKMLQTLIPKVLAAEDLRKKFIKEFTSKPFSS